MKQKTIKIIYWITTVLFALFMLFSGLTGLMPNEQTIETMKHLGYAPHVIIIISIAKILGSIALLQNKYKTIKEWAYSGFTIDIIGASASIYFVGDGIGMVLFPLVFLAVMFVSYFSWKRLGVKKSKR